MNDSVIEKIDLLLGKTMVHILRDGMGKYILFVDNEGKSYLMYHDTECSEDVYIDDICGDLNDLIGSPIIVAERFTNCTHNKDLGDGSFTYTFFKLATTKGYVNIRWYGTSNGYYSEDAHVVLLNENNKYLINEIRWKKLLH